jgi:hypothetical protein
MTGALAARGSTEGFSTEGFTLDWCYEQAVDSNYRKKVGTTLFDADANVCLWHLADIDFDAKHVCFRKPACSELNKKRTDLALRLGMGPKLSPHGGRGGLAKGRPRATGAPHVLGTLKLHSR